MNYICTAKMNYVHKEGTQVPSFFSVKAMISVERIRKLADEKIVGTTNFIVDVSVRPGNNITVLLDNDAGVSINDCVAMSRYIESNLDRESEDFELNVMSPGLTEPFKILRQYQKNQGKQVDVLTTDNKKISGKLIGVTEDGILLETRTRERIEGKKSKQLIINNINLTFNQIKQTKVVISF